MYRQLVIRKLLRDELKRLIKLERTMQLDRKWLPDGSLVKREDRIYRVVRHEGKQLQLRINENTADGKKLIHELKHRRYVKAAIPVLKEQIQLLTKYLRKSDVYDPVKIQESLGEQYQGMEGLPIFLEGDVDPESWRLQKAETMYENGLIHLSEGGLKTRSKAESMIATCLEKSGLKFHYEPRVDLKDGIARPDFEVMLEQKRKIVYWEHLGKIEDPEYVMKNLKKLQDYAENGIYLGINLVITYETKEEPLTFITINEVIRKIKSM